MRLFPSCSCRPVSEQRKVLSYLCNILVQGYYCKCSFYVSNMDASSRPFIRGRFLFCETVDFVPSKVSIGITFCVAVSISYSGTGTNPVLTKLYQSGTVVQ